MQDRLADKVAVARKADADDFIRRAPKPSPWLMSGLLTVAFFVLLGASYNAPSMGTTALVSLLTAIFLGLIGYVTYQVLKLNDMMLASDFENALYAGGASTGTEFTVMLKSTGEIAYMSPGFYKLFSRDVASGTKTFDSLLLGMGLLEADKTILIEALKNGTSGRVSFSITDGFGLRQQLEVLLEPIKRPKGFAIVRAFAPGKLQTASNVAAPAQGAAPSASSMFGMLTRFFDQLPMGCYALNEKNNFIYANSMFSDMVGKTADSLSEGTLQLGQVVFGSADMAGFGASWHGEIAFRNRLNKPVKSYVTQIATGSEEGGIRYGFVMTADSGAQQTDKKQGDKIREFMDNAPLAVALLDENGFVKHSNLAMRRIMGKPPEENTGWSLVQSLKQEQKAEAHALIKSAKEEGYDPLKHIMEVRITHPDRHEVSASLYITRGYKPNIEEPQFIAFLVDTTEFKNLEQRVVHSQKMQAVGQLAGGIAHDFNNLLTAMMGFCDLLLIRHPAGDPSFSDIMQVKQNANRAAGLVRQLLAFSRKQTLQPVVMDITDILADLSNLLRRLIGENIELKITHGRDLSPVKVDQGQFEQVIINLAVNARDAMKGGGTLTIRTQNVTIDRANPIDPKLLPPAEDEEIVDGDYSLIEISDTGTGIEPDIIRKIFEPFFSTKEIGSGTGLGLATVYGIIKQTGGYIYVSSKLREGTSFSIFLPRASESEKVQQKEALEKEEKAVSDLTGAGTVLLVEDEDPVRIFSARALRNKGYHVLEADCGEAALAMMQERGSEIELVVTDVVMPGINGPTMVEEIMRNYKEISVIFISGYGEDAFFKTYGTERKFNFLPKPFTLKQLAMKVKEVMDARPKDKAAPKS